GPGNEIAALIELRNDPSLAGDWPIVTARELRAAKTAIATTPQSRRRFAVFSLGRIPLAVQLGYILGDRAHVELYNYDRDRATWAWPDCPPPQSPPPAISWTLTECPEGRPDEAAVRVSLSAAIHPEPALRAALEIDIRNPEPSVR